MTLKQPLLTLHFSHVKPRKVRLDSNKGDDKGKGKGKDGGIGFLCAFCAIFHVSEALSDLVAGKKGKGKDDKGKGKGKKGVSLEWWLQMC